MTETISLIFSKSMTEAAIKMRASSTITLKGKGNCNGNLPYPEQKLMRAMAAERSEGHAFAFIEQQGNL